MEWISCNDELPPLGKSVLAFENFGSGRVVQKTRTKKFSHLWEPELSTNFFFFQRYTHWMPLPKSPNNPKSE